MQEGREPLNDLLSLPSAQRLLQLFSWRQEVVADPFVGRGTTAAVAARLGRGVRALDRAQAYVTLTQSWVSRVRAAARLSSLAAE